MITGFTFFIGVIIGYSIGQYFAQENIEREKIVKSFFHTQTKI